jgi:hypothetical protein
MVLSNQLEARLPVSVLDLDQVPDRTNRPDGHALILVLDLDHGAFWQKRAS